MPHDIVQAKAIPGHRPPPFDAALRLSVGPLDVVERGAPLWTTPSLSTSQIAARASLRDTPSLIIAATS